MSNFKKYLIEALNETWGTGEWGVHCRGSGVNKRCEVRKLNPDFDNCKPNCEQFITPPGGTGLTWREARELMRELNGPNAQSDPVGQHTAGAKIQHRPTVQARLPLE